MAVAVLSDIVARVQALVNDTPAAVYTQAVLLPYINTAQDEVAAALRNHGVAFTKFRSSVLTVTAGTTSLYIGSSPTLPTNLVEPITMWERPSGGAEQDFYPMFGPSTLPNYGQNQTLTYWDYYQDATNGPTILTLGATTNREVRIDYYGDLTSFASSGDKLLIYGAQNVVAYRTASLVCLSRGDNDGAQAFNLVYEKNLGTLCSEQVKEGQARPGRRLPARGIARYLIVGR